MKVTELAGTSKQEENRTSASRAQAPRLTVPWRLPTEELLLSLGPGSPAGPEAKPASGVPAFALLDSLCIWDPISGSKSSGPAVSHPGSRLLRLESGCASVSPAADGVTCEVPTRCVGVEVIMRAVVRMRMVTVSPVL